MQTTTRSLIVKQARPWVEKYPQFEAPWERILRESEFYKRVANTAAAAMMPRWIGCDESHHLLLLEDLGAAGDYRSVYGQEHWQDETLESLASHLSALHRISGTGKFANRAMRELNLAHIFHIPLQSDNGLDLDAIQPGLAQAAAPILADTTYIQAVASLGRDAYLTDGPCLLHGDFFPGSLIKTDAGPRVIDPEFAFFGRPEFDVSVFVAHLHLAKQADKESSFLSAYEKPASYDKQLQDQLVGVEIMRRLIGYAQLDLSLTIGEKEKLLERSRQLVLGT